MSREYTYHCDGPDCEVQQRIASEGLPFGWVLTREHLGADVTDMHFHCWECVMKRAAQVPPPEIIPIREEESDG